MKNQKLEKMSLLQYVETFGPKPMSPYLKKIAESISDGEQITYYTGRRGRQFHNITKEQIESEMKMSNGSSLDFMIFDEAVGIDKKFNKTQ